MEKQAYFYRCHILVTFPSHLKKILTRKVELWIFSLVKKHHITSFLVKISVQKITMCTSFPSRESSTFMHCVENRKCYYCCILISDSMRPKSTLNIINIKQCIHFWQIKPVSFGIEYNQGRPLGPKTSGAEWGREFQGV